MLDKQRSAERWPAREYTLRPNSLSATCTQGTLTCEVEGIVNWKVSNSETKAAATGTTGFVFTVYSGGTTHYEPFVILLESSTDWPTGDAPRYPQASCDIAPLFNYPGASGVAVTEDPWVGERGRPARATPISASGPERPRVLPVSSAVPPVKPSGGATIVAVPASATD
jgi:hypothetical protein